MSHKHPANIARRDSRSPGERAADKVSEVVGSWRFIWTQTLVVALWISLNLTAVGLRWDPYPFILLNLCFSTQAAYAAPILQLSQNQQSEHDRRRAEHDFEVNEETLRLIREIYESNAPR